MGSLTIMGNKSGRPVLREEDVAALSLTSGLTEDQVRNTFTSFIADHPNGRLMPKDFRQMMQKALPKKDATKMEKHVFRIYDTDGSGDIDFTEFMVVFHIMSDGTPEEVMSKIFRVFDLNGDGVITAAEMNKIVKDMYGLLKTENPDLEAEKLLSKSAFTEMDKNNDGQITQEEFIKACLGQEEISRILALKIIDIFCEEEQK